jgi:hypothetical protein
MALALDTGRTLRTRGELTALVEAIRDADPGEHETDWLEWKRELDLGKDAGHTFAVARHILGFGNRDPVPAALHCEGAAYLVVGAEPGAVRPVPDWDPADLDNWIGRYVAPGSPRWRADRVDVDGGQVLVFTVEAPSSGDPICTLRRGSDRDPPGRIVVRRGGKTVEASPSEIGHLEARLLRGGADIEVALDAEVAGDGLRALSMPDEAFERWRDREHDSLIGSLPPAPDRSNPFALAMPSISYDPRSRQEFVAEVDEFLERSRALWLASAYRKAMEARLAVIGLTIVNHGSRNFPATQLELSLPDGVLAFAEEGDPDRILDPPARPRPFNSPPRIGALADLAAMGRGARQIDFRRSEGTVHFLPVDVRPGRRHRLPELHLGIPAQMAGEALGLTWRATSTGATSWAEGSLEFPVADPPALLTSAGGGEVPR